MRQTPWPSVIRKLLAEVPDADLLERYVQRKDDDAFAQLVNRYSRLVWGQCRNLLACDADVDDAFQATFLALARGAKSIRAGAPLGPWLHGTAYRVCQNARRANGRRVKREQAKAQPEANRPVADSTWEEAFTAVAEEVQKLPAAQRTAFVLCCIEGRTANDAAKTLGQKIGTFSARLSRAKQTLLDRLARRGIGAGVLALGGVTGSVALAPAAVIEHTLALLPTGTIIPSSIQTLLNGVHGMSLMKVKLLAAAVLVASGLGLSLGNGWYGSAQAQFAAPPAAKNADADLEKLKADLERAKALLAEAEKTKKNELELATDLYSKSVRDYQKKAVESLRKSTESEATKPFPIKYEYEAVPKEGYLPKEFEAKLATREKNGWEFLGQVNMKSEDNQPKDQKGPVAATAQLVFRKKPKSDATWLDMRNFDWKNSLPAVVELANPFGPAAPPAPAKAPNAPVAPVGSVKPIDPPTVPSMPTPVANPQPTPKPAVKELPEPRVYYPGELPDDVRSKLVQAELDRLRIAALEKELKELKEKTGMFPKAVEAPAKKANAFTKAQYGNWDSEDLASVLKAIVEAQIKIKKMSGDITIDAGPEGIYLSGTPENIDAVAAWIKKLKK